VTDENRRRNIRDELARADEALHAGRALLELGLHADSVSRAYYGAWHALRALLLSRGLEAKTHAGAIHLFNVEFVRTGPFATAHNRLLAGMQRARELADYDAAVMFSREDAEAYLQDAVTFRAAVAQYLREHGWTT
jgi:uncharacterized protein (UPF0332 family)